MKSKKHFIFNNISAKAIKQVFDISPKDCIKMMFVQIIASFCPMLLGITVQYVINNIYSVNMATIIMYIFLYILLFSFHKYINIYFNHYYVIYKIMPNFERQIKLELFKYANEMSLEDYDDAEIANGAMRAKNASVNLFRLCQAYTEIFGAIVSCIILLSAGLLICWQTLVFLIIIAISVIVENYNHIKIEAEVFYAKTQIEKEYDENIDFILNPQKYKEIEIFNIYDFVHSHIETCWKALYNMKKKKNAKICEISLFYGFIACISKVIALILLFVSYNQGSIDLGSVAFAMISFLNISEIIDEIFSVQGYISQFSNLVIPFFQYKEKYANTAPKILVDEFHTIELRNVFYKYKNQSNFALSNINIKINKGEKVLIVGENGSGKTTLLNVISGMIKSKTGCVIINGSIFTDNENVDTFHNFAKVPQSINLYPVSLFNNITFGKNNRCINMHEEFTNMGLKDLYDRIDNIVGKEFGGENYSGGEKQKIGIIRAKSKNSEILLLDEATSAIDALQEDEIIEQLCAFLKDRTAVIVSHKLSYAKRVDRIIVLRNGKIYEEGTHNELIKYDGIYSNMWRMQVKGYVD